MSGGCVDCRKQVVYYRIDAGEIYLPPDPTFDLPQIADSGQCFRIRQIEKRKWIAITGSHYVIITEGYGGGYFFQCSEEDFCRIWIPYFDLATDYGVYHEAMQEDPFLEKAICVGGGIRILNQDAWETVVSFVISQRNNIPKIRGSIERLCEKFGTNLGEVNGMPIYAFPHPSQLFHQDLSGMGLGYRQKYVENLSSGFDFVWNEKALLSDNDLKEYLLQKNGIGEKVANCIMLFGYHRLNSYPRDVWINRMIDEVYHGEFDSGQYPGFAGYVQQVQFFYYRMLKKGVKV